MKLTDGKRTIEIECQEWNGSGYNPDYSNYFLESTEYELVEDTDMYYEEDLDELIEWAIENFKKTEDDFMFIYELQDGEWEQIAKVNNGEVEK